MKVPLSTQFWAWILGGLFILICAYLIVAHSICAVSLDRHEARQGTDESDNRPSGLRHLIDESALRNIALAQSNQKNGESYDESAKAEINNLAPNHIFCDAKGTDIGLVYFTYCLVIVGWFGIRSSALSVQNLERAFLAVGPTGIMQLYKGPDESGITKPFIRVGVHVYNTGKTGATIRKVYGEFSRTPPTSNAPIYKNGSEEITDLSVAAGDKGDLSPIVFEDDFVGDQFFWGYLEYLDIFKVRHTARFCARIVPQPPPSGGKFQLAGSESWRECD